MFAEIFSRDRGPICQEGLCKSLVKEYVYSIQILSKCGFFIIESAFYGHRRTNCREIPNQNTG
jgi:hypothetical protein